VIDEIELVFIMITWRLQPCFERHEVFVGINY